jgi:cytochrome c oxidase subunit 2
VSVFHPQSPQAQAISTLFTSFLWLAAIIFLVVAGLVSYSIVRYRARGGEAEPRQHFGSWRIEVTWTAIPLLIVIVIFIFTVRTMAFVDAPLEPGQPPDLVIIGHQWWWEARYPNGAVTASEIHIPTQRRLLARIDSADVIHDFWVPQLARKMDAVPGRSGYLWLEADTAGIYQGTCSEFCGMQHAWMRFLVVAEPEADFSAWLRHQAETPAEPVAGLEAGGARIFREQKCLDCHADSQKGPPLSHIAGRRLLGGDLPNTPQNLTRWITNPQSIKPGNRMPDSRVSGEEARALAAYLETLQ